MKERPIIFSSEMIRAVLDNKKSQTRRPIKPQPELDVCRGWWWKGKCYGIVASLYGNKFPVAKLIQDMRTACPYQIGDILWVKQTCKYYGYAGGIILVDKAGLTWRPNDFLPQDVWVEFADKYRNRWCPAIFMPKWASRITLEIINIRVERIQDISEEDAIVEGVDGALFADDGSPDYILAFRYLWDSIWAKKGFGWDQNPWVNVIEFRRIENEMDKR